MGRTEFLPKNPCVEGVNFGPSILKCAGVKHGSLNIGQFCTASMRRVCESCN